MKTYRFVITVEGNGQFPVDMLRYDACWPRAEHDSHKVSRDWLDGESPGRRQIELLTDHDYKRWLPNVDRWRSFGWQVVKVELAS